MKSCLLSELNFWWKKVWIWWSVHWCIFLTRSYMPLKSEVKESTQQMVFLTVRLLPASYLPDCLPLWGILRFLYRKLPEVPSMLNFSEYLIGFTQVGYRSGTVIFGLKHFTEVSAFALLCVMLMSRYWNLVHALNDTNISV